MSKQSKYINYGTDKIKAKLKVKKKDNQQTIKLFKKNPIIFFPNKKSKNKHCAMPITIKLNKKQKHKSVEEKKNELPTRTTLI